MRIIKVLKELNFEPETPIKMQCDSMSAIAMVRNHVHHERTKYVDIDKHFIKEKEDKGIIKLAYVSSKRQVGDLFTKVLARPQFEEFRSKLRMIDIYSPT